MKTSNPVLLLACGLLALAAPAPAEAPDWQPAVPDSRWSFPRDHWAHREYQTEWWYFTGQLTPDGETEPRFGYQFTFFRIGVTPDDLALDSGWGTQGLIMGHAAISNQATGEHRFAELLYRESAWMGGFAAYPEHPIAWSRAPRGSAGRWELDWSPETGYSFHASDDEHAFSFRLVTTPSRSRPERSSGG